MRPAMARLGADIAFRGKVLETVPFDVPALRIGRMPENDIVIDNIAVSRYHARLLVADGRVYLEDAGSENGALVNGVRVTERREIAAGDRIAIGKHELLVRRPVEGDPAQRRQARRKSDAWDANRTFVFGMPAAGAAPREPVPPSPRPERKEATEMTANAPKSGAPPMPDTVELDYEFDGSLSDEAQGPSTVRLTDSNPPAQPPLHAGFIVQRDGK